ncbi:hypothetical protein [Steroidobacter denitrificans]|nr:hypothetical protein [Steroidobacter denitrificans]
MGKLETPIIVELGLGGTAPVHRGAGPVIFLLLGALPAACLASSSAESYAEAAAAASAGVFRPPEQELPEEDQNTLEDCEPDETILNGVLQKVRRTLTISACTSSAWLDGLFGGVNLYDQYRQTHGTVSAGGLWSEYSGLDPRLRFRVHLQLPQWNKRISAFIGRMGEDNFISDTESDFEALPTRQFGNLENESVLVGLGYSNPRRTGNDFDAGLGVRVDLPLDPFTRLRYEIVRTFADHYVITARETVFWQNSEGFGTTTRVNLDRALSRRFLLRWGNLGKFTEETVGLEWYSQVTLFQSLSERSGLAWQIQVDGATENEVPLTRYSGRLIMRRQLTPEWLILELRGGMEWPRRRLTEARTMSPEVGIALEMQFGQSRNRSDR